MNIKELKNSIKGIDIYLLDQIIKDRYGAAAVILDAGCGNGRNLKWFYENNFELYGVDTNTQRIEYVKQLYKNIENRFSVQNLDVMDFENNTFDHIICSAVLHFAQNTQHFFNMVAEMVRVLKPGGTIFLRMTSWEAFLEGLVKKKSDGVYLLPDGSNRFLLTKEILIQLQNNFNLKLIEPYKSVRIANERSMATLLFQKE